MFPLQKELERIHWVTIYLFFFDFMALRREIKDFTKKVVLLGFFLSVCLNLVITYFSGLDDTVQAEASNDVQYKRVGSAYLGAAGVAVSMNIGTKEKDRREIPLNLYDEVMPIGTALADKGTGEKRVLASHMVAANAYINILRTDVNKLLDSATDREATLESFVDQLKYRYKSTDEYLANLRLQGQDLSASATASEQKIAQIKTDLTNAYRTFDYDKTEDLVNRYIEEKQRETTVKTYLVFINRFIDTYTTLNAYNKLLLDTLINNREALIKDVTVVLPDSGTKLMNKLNLVKTESEFKSGN